MATIRKSARKFDFKKLRNLLAAHLFGNIVPFWMRHAVDPAGGLNTCIRDDGSVVSRDKWLWSQWRAVWVFSRLYNRFERRPEWLELAKRIAAFSEKYGWNEKSGGWALLLSGDGKVLKGCESIYVNGFAIYGLTELGRATGERRYAELARKTADLTLSALGRPHDTIPHFPYPIPAGYRVHGLPMIFSLVFWELGQWLDDNRYRRAALAMSDEIFGHFYRPGRDLLLERIRADRTEGTHPEGTVVVPGHVIEDMWFQMHIARESCRRKRLSEAARLIRRHLEAGWDREYGGILLAVDAEGKPGVGWRFADSKLWWPHTEAMYALLLAFEHTRDDWFLKAYDKVHKYAFSHFPVPDHGEWTQNLDRRGRKFKEVVALPVKDPFHLPRSLMYCVEVLQRLDSK